MDLANARTELTGALREAERSNSPFRPALNVLVARGVEALGITPRPGLSLGEVVRFAIDAAASAPRRAYAVLLVHALGQPGLVPVRGQIAFDVQSFLERALLNPLRRAGYPFEGTPYEKRHALATLHLTIDEHLRPPEPSIPRWIHGIGPADQ